MARPVEMSRKEFEAIEKAKRARATVHDETPREHNGVALGPGSPLRAVSKRQLAMPDVDTKEQEHIAQSRVFSEIDALPDDHPLRDTYAIPNFSGFHGSKKARELSGARAKAEGRRKDFLDICVPHARLGYHALYVELKVYPAQFRIGQREWANRLTLGGNKVVLIRARSADTLATATFARLMQYITSPRDLSAAWADLGNPEIIDLDR